MTKTKAGPGRPPKPAAERRRHAIKLRVTDSMRRTMEAMATERGMTLSGAIEKILEEHGLQWLIYTPNVKRSALLRIKVNLENAIEAATSAIHRLKAFEQRVGETPEAAADIEMLGKLVPELNRIQHLVADHIAASEDDTALYDHRKPDYVNVPAAMLRDSEYYALEVEGDSMIEAGILDGDTVVIERCDSAKSGAIVVVEVGSEDGPEIMLRRYRRDGQDVRLEPANAAVETVTLPADSVKIVGRLAGMMRQYDAQGSAAPVPKTQRKKRAVVMTAANGKFIEKKVTAMGRWAVRR